MYTLEEVDSSSAEWSDQATLHREAWSETNEERDCGDDEGTLLRERYPTPRDIGGTDHPF